MILLASDIAEQDETYFETIPMTVKRNAYGRQLGSFHTNAEASGIGEIPMTFIRAPYVESVHTDTSGNTPEILSIVEDRIVGVKYKNQDICQFHLFTISASSGLLEQLFRRSPCCCKNCYDHCHKWCGISSLHCTSFICRIVLTWLHLY